MSNSSTNEIIDNTLAEDTKDIRKGNTSGNKSSIATIQAVKTFINDSLDNGLYTDYRTEGRIFNNEVLEQLQEAIADYLRTNFEDKYNGLDTNVCISIKTLKERLREIEKDRSKLTKKEKHLEKTITRIRNLLKNDIYEVKTYITEHKSIDVLTKTIKPMTFYTIVVIVMDYQSELLTYVTNLISSEFFADFHHIVSSADNIVINCDNEGSFYKLLGILNKNKYGELNENNNPISSFTTPIDSDDDNVSTILS